MFVKANTTGYAGGELRHAGDVFEIGDDVGPASWFDPVEATAPSSVKRKATKEELDALNAEKRAAAEAALAAPPKSEYDPIGTNEKG